MSLGEDHGGRLRTLRVQRHGSIVATGCAVEGGREKEREKGGKQYCFLPKSGKNVLMFGWQMVDAGVVQKYRAGVSGADQ